MRKLLKTMIIIGASSLLILTSCANDSSVTYEYNPEQGQEYEYSTTYENEFSHLRTPYVGSAHETHAVVDALPLPGENWVVRSIQIGTDHGDFSTDHSPYALTIFYEPRQGSAIEGYDSRHSLDIPRDVFVSNTDLLFELIENLEAVTFSVNFFYGEDESFFDYRWSRSRGGEYSLQINDGYQGTVFELFIDKMENVNLGFGNFFEVNYNDAFEEIRGFRFDGGGDRLVIWANSPLYNLSLIALSNDFVNDEFRFFATDTVFSIDKLNPGSADAFVINDYYGMGTMPWSGISFENEFGVRRYFWLQQSGYDGRFHLNEFEPWIVLEAMPNSDSGLVWLVAPTLPHDFISICFGGFIDSQRRIIDPVTGQLTDSFCPGHGGIQPGLVYDREKQLFGDPGDGNGYHVVLGMHPMDEFADVLESWSRTWSRGLIAIEAVDSSVREEIGGDSWEAWWLMPEAFSGQFALMYDRQFVTDFIFDGVGRLGGSGAVLGSDYDHIAVSMNGKWGLVNKYGNVTFDFMFENLVMIDEHTAFAKYNGAYGILDIRNSRLP